MIAILAAALALIASLVLTLSAILPLTWGILLLLIAFWFCAPGVLVARSLYGRGTWLASLLVGAVWGYALSCLVLLGLWIAGLRGSVLLVLPPVLALLVVWPARRWSGCLALPRFTRKDAAALLLLLLLVPMVVGRPFARVGETVEGGRAYRAYFTADFVWRMAVVAELSKGDVPPHNQFYLDDTLHYYWLAHLLPSVEYRQWPHLTNEQVLLVNSLALDLVFIAFFFFFVRHFVRGPTAAALGCTAGVLFTSFEGTERLWSLWSAGASLDLVRQLNIDAVTRWIYGSMPVDGLHRLLLYQPHHAMGYAIGFSALLCVVQACPKSRTSNLEPPTSDLESRTSTLEPRTFPWSALMAMVGSLLAACLLLSTFSAVMITAMVAVYALARLVMVRQWRAIATGALAGAVPLALGLTLASALRYADRGDLLVRIRLNHTAVTSPVVGIFLSFGPMLIAGGVGAWLAVRRRATELGVVGIVIAISLWFYFFVDVRDHQFVYVGWRAGHFLFMALAVLVGFAIQELWRGGTRTKIATTAGALLLALAAAPLTAIDLYNTQDLTNREKVTEIGGGFRWTLVLTRDEVEALDWIRHFTPADAIVQVEPYVRHTTTWAYVPAFAERRMSTGIPISMVPLAKYMDASRIVRGMYHMRDAGQVHERAAQLRIDYLVVGPPERHKYPNFEPLLNANPDRFGLVFRNRSVAIYHVAR
ncbi:MAG: hypothetical protein GEV06_13235 [Luteitalea sp.]|nr:hypothetical protein [Luteitalea sp.]